MIYLSRILLDIRQRSVQQLLGNCHDLHTFVLRGFPQISAQLRARDHFGVLFRPETPSHDAYTARIIIQSQHAPDWSWIKPAWLATAPDQRGNPAIRLIDHEYGTIGQGSTLFFRLRANPTKRISRHNESQQAAWRGKRIDLRSDEDRLMWFERQGAQHGFRIAAGARSPAMPSIRITPQASVRGWQKSRHALTFGAAMFEGVLEVTDTELFRAALVEGVGKGKAYGFGLVSVAQLGG